MIIKRKNRPRFNRKLSLFVCKFCEITFHRDHGCQLYCEYCKKHNRHEFGAQGSYNNRIRKEIFEHYGNKCSRCGEDDPIVLSIDHVNNDGKEERKKYASTQQIWLKIKREKFPANYQLLCRNCNWRKNIEHRNMRGYSVDNPVYNTVDKSI